jgi:hypothetical protein
MSKLTFDTWLYDRENDTEHNITVEVHTYYSGTSATYYEPAQDAELEYSVYLEDGGDCIYRTLTPEQQGDLDERVWDYVSDYYSNYYYGG